MRIILRTVNNGGGVGYRDMVMQEMNVNAMDQFRNLLKQFDVERVLADSYFGITILVNNSLTNWPIDGTVVSLLDGKMFQIREDWPKKRIVEL